MKHLKRFNESGNLIKNPNSMIVGQQYKVIESVYDDFDEGLEPEVDFVEVISKDRGGVTLRNVEHDYTYSRTFDHLRNCEIYEV